MRHYSATIIRKGCCPTAAVIDGTGRVIATATSNSNRRAIARAIDGADAILSGIARLADEIGAAALLEVTECIPCGLGLCTAHDLRGLGLSNVGYEVAA